MNYFSSYPPASENNPFFKLLTFHLEKSNWKDATFNFKINSLLMNRGKVKILWFHWPSSLWRSSNSFLRSLKVTKFIINIFIAKLLGFKLVWSAHNVLPHEYSNFKLEFFMRKFICKYFDLIIGHSNNTLEMLNAKNLFAKKYVLAVHGHYENEYKELNKNITRTILGFTEKDKIILLKSNGKNFASAKEFLNSIKGNNYQNIKFLIIGQPILNVKNTKIIEGYVSNVDLASYMSLCDYVCLPYDNITTSGAFFLALTFNKPVIAKRILFFSSHTNSKTAILYNDIESLKSKLHLLDCDEIEFNNNDIIALKEKYLWSKSAVIISKNLSVL